MKNFYKKIPNELLADLQGRFGKSDIEADWGLLTNDEKIKEITWCIDKCYMDYADNPERRIYLRGQIKRLENLKNKLKLA